MIQREGMGTYIALGVAAGLIGLAALRSGGSNENLMPGVKKYEAPAIKAEAPLIKAEAPAVPAETPAKTETKAETPVVVAAAAKPEPLTTRAVITVEGREGTVALNPVPAPTAPENKPAAVTTPGENPDHKVENWL